MIKSSKNSKKTAKFLISLALRIAILLIKNEQIKIVLNEFLNKLDDIFDALEFDINNRLTH